MSGHRFPSTTKAKRTLNIDSFRGVDFASNPWEMAVGRSPDAVNLIPSSGGYPETRPGAREMVCFAGRINGVYDFYFGGGKVRLVHHGDKISRWNVDNSTNILYEGIKNIRSSAIQLRDKMMILDGREALLVYREDDEVRICPLSQKAYVPTTTIGRKAGENMGGKAFEAVNMVGCSRKNTFCVSEEGATELYMDVAPIKKVNKVETLLKNGIWVEVSYKSVNLMEGKLTFDVLSTTPVSGMDNYRVEFDVDNLGEVDKREEFTVAEADRVDEHGLLVWTFVGGKEGWAEKYWFKIGEDLPRETVEVVIVPRDQYYEYVQWEGRGTQTKPKPKQYPLTLRGNGSNIQLRLGFWHDSYDESYDDVVDEPGGMHYIDVGLVQEGGIWYLTVVPAHSCTGGGYGSYMTCGLGRVIISYKTDTYDLYAGRINGCSVAGVFGVGGNADRVFVSGNAAHKNMDWMSGFEDITYWPDTGYTKIGNEGCAVVGYSWLSDGVQAIHKEEAAGDSTIWYRSGGLDENGEAVFSMKQGAVGVGAISSRCFAHFGTDNLMLSGQGVYAVTHAGNEAMNERYAALRSWFINPRLCAEGGLSEAVAIGYRGRYYLAVDGRVYVADIDAGSSYERRAGGYQYDWWYWEGLPVRVWYSENGQLMFGAEDGRIYVLDNRCYDNVYGENRAIECHWLTPVLDLGTRVYYKKIKNVYPIAEPYKRSCVRLAYALRGVETEVMDRRMSVFDFNDIDFADFAFETDPMPRNLSAGAKIKRVMFIQFRLRNEPGRDFGLYGLTVLYTVGGKYKG